MVQTDDSGTHEEVVEETSGVRHKSVDLDDGVFVPMINLRLILVSGRTKEFLFCPNDSAADITDYVYSNWPQEWLDEKLPNANILRLIYQGRFLHGNVTLGALQLQMGKTTVMHLVPREHLPEPNNPANLKKDKNGESSCSNCCVLL